MLYVICCDVFFSWRPMLFLHECVSFNENVFFYELCINWKLDLVKLTYLTTNLYSSWIALDEENSINVYTYVTSFSFSFTVNHASPRKKGQLWRETFVILGGHNPRIILSPVSFFIKVSWNFQGYFSIQGWNSRSFEGLLDIEYRNHS